MRGLGLETDSLSLDSGTFSSASRLCKWPPLLLCDGLAASKDKVGPAAGSEATPGVTLCGQGLSAGSRRNERCEGKGLWELEAGRCWSPEVSC